MLETLEFFRQKLDSHQPVTQQTNGCMQAAVSLIFRPNTTTAAPNFPFDLLLMQRAYDASDPWSGQVSFPGGRFENSDKSLRATAERETQEEVGVRLAADDYLGQNNDVLGPITGNKKTVHVSSFVYHLEIDPLINLNYEVAQVIWANFDELLEPKRYTSFEHPFVTGVTMQGIRLNALSHDGEPLILWGLSLRIMQQLLEILEFKSA